MPARLFHSIPEPPSDLPEHHREWMTAVTNTLRTMVKSQTPPKPVTQPTVTPIAQGNVIDFTRTDADKYLIYHSTDNNFANAAAIDIGLSSRYFDAVGNGGIAKHYWVVPLKGNMIGPASPPGKGVTLAAGAVVTLPPPRPISGNPTGGPDGRPVANTFPPIRE